MQGRSISEHSPPKVRGPDVADDGARDTWAGDGGDDGSHGACGRDSARCHEHTSNSVRAWHGHAKRDGHHARADQGQAGTDNQHWCDAQAQCQRERSGERRRDATQTREAGVRRLIAQSVRVVDPRHQRNLPAQI